MANKQPFYHRAVVLFTATRELPNEEVKDAVTRSLGRLKGVLKDSIELEECDAEAGDPHDLM
jgi:hypothetical protein